MSRPGPAPGGLALAEQAYALVQVSPGRAATLAERALGVARKEGDAEAQVAALHALSWAQRVIGDPRAARTARAGIRIGERDGARRRVALLRRNFAHTLAFAGSIKAAHREIDAAIADLHGRDRLESEVFRIAIHRSAHAVDPGTHRAVLAAAARALRAFEREGDAIWAARLLNNRGALHLDRGELDAAEADFRRAYALYRQGGANDAAADTAVGLAETALLRGDVVACLAAIEDVKVMLPPGSISFSLLYCEAAALAQARLLPEAEVAIEAYMDSCSRSGRGDYVPMALLDASTIAILSGDAATAMGHARRAVRSFASRGKPVDAARARAMCLRAQLLGGNIRRSSLRSGLEAAEVLEKAGWRRDALRTRLLVARAGLALGSDALARRQLDLARPLHSRGSVADRIELCHTRALMQLARSNTAAALRSLKQGLRLLEEYRAALGAVELRATASTIGIELSQTGLRLALDSGNPARVLDWTERLRANALRLPFVKPPADSTLRTRQVQLRRVANQLRDAELKGKPVRGLATRQDELEAEIRARTRRIRGEDGPVTPAPTTRAASRALGERVLIEYVELEGVLHAITLARGRSALHKLSEVSPTTELEWLRFALGRLARGNTAPAQRAAAHGNAQAAAGALDRLLVEPLLPTLGDAPLVVVPTGALHALPWGVLPSLRGRPVVVAPSLAIWLDLAVRPRPRRRKTALIAGPGLRHSAPEVRSLGPLAPRAIVLTGRDATATAAMAALDGAQLAHVACHGRFRSDSPLFSSLELADGPLTALDLQRLGQAPEILVLSSCELALSDRHPGDELLGLSAALLAMGTRTIVASVVPVPDAAARRLMLSFHRALGAGAPPATALARVQAALPRASAALAGFVCLGTG